jgi:hypothetical protein
LPDKAQAAQIHEDKTPVPKSSLPRRIAITFATQTVFLGICLIALNMIHGKYDLTLDMSDIPWWQMFSSFGVANICAQVVLSRAGVGHIL